MATYRYTARDAAGNEVVGKVDASTADEARLLLEKRGLDVADVSQADAHESGTKSPLSSEEAEQLAGHLAQVSAGNLPLAPGLRAAAEESENPRVASALCSIAAQIERGRTLEDILAASDGLVPRHISGLLVAAARTGKLADALSELVEHQRSARALRRDIAGGFAYPLVVACLATVVLLFIVTFAAGSYGQLFYEFQCELPLLTILFFWWRHIGLWLIAGVIIIGLIAVAVVRVRQGRAGWLRLVATIPLFGPLWRWSGFAEWASLLSVLTRNQIPLPEALRLSGDGLSNEHVGEVSHRLADGAENGQAVWRLLSTSREAPNSLIPLLRWGEEKGILAEAFGTGRQMLEARVRTRSLLLQSILPPILFIAIGCCVLFVVGALFVPLVTLVECLS